MNIYTPTFSLKLFYDKDFFSEFNLSCDKFSPFFLRKVKMRKNFDFFSLTETYMASLEEIPCLELSREIVNGQYFKCKFKNYLALL